MEPFVYYLPAAISVERLNRELSADSSERVLLERAETEEAVLLDTFDGALFAEDQLLFKAGELLLLFDLQVIALHEQAAPPGLPPFCDMNRGPVVDLLLEVVPLRAPRAVEKVRLRREEGRVVDDQGKTLVRFVQLLAARGRNKMVGVGCALPLRGYDDAGLQLKLWLEKCGAVPCRGIADLYQGMKLRPSFFQAKPSITLDPSVPVRDNALILLRTFFAVARANEPGIIGDVDSEFLHDYRVALRKLRSLLILIKGVFDDGDVARLKEQLAAVMRTTNALRDLDVYLLRRADYHRLVPPSTHGGLQLLFDTLARHRREQQKRMAGTMAGKAYKRRMTELGKGLAGGDGLKAGPLAGENTQALAARLILKRYKRICKVGRTLDHTTPDESIHELRIHCKKLRYLMEFFASLFADEEIRGLIRSLKQLQDTLGTFNDLSVQQSFLATLLSGEGSGGARGIPLAHAVGALTAMLHHLQGKERNRIFDHLANFAGAEMRDSFKEVFANRGESDEDTRLLQQ